MKTFDYRGVNLKSFVLVLGDTTQAWKQVMLFPTHLKLLVQHTDSIGYVAIQNLDANGHLFARDLVKLVIGGQASLLFDTDADVVMRYWTDYDLTKWYQNDPTLWHVVHRVPR